jgi:DNA-directed RNA polymerase subunit RPC12/RpoP
MAMINQTDYQNDNRIVDQEAEFLHAEEAYEEYVQTGRTKLRCLRCGGQFIFQGGASGHEIRCENSDFKITCRGI